MFWDVLPDKKNNLPLRLVFLHGWGASHEGFAGLYSYFSDVAECVVMDLPGFGRSPEPENPMSPADYAREVLAVLDKLPKKKTALVCHSFGARIALHLYAINKNAVDAMVFIAGAGLRKKRSPVFKLKAMCMRNLAHTLRRLGMADLLGNLKLGSEDYRKASPIMRKALVMAVNEDLEETAKTVKCPVLLCYGEKDEATPPEFGRRFAVAMDDAELFMVKGENHLSILSSPMVQNLMEEFLKARFKWKSL